MASFRIGHVALAAALAVAVSSGPPVHADPIQATYTTTGLTETFTTEGSPVVSFQGVSKGTLTTGEPFSLGNFIVSEPPGGANPSFAAQFQITFTATGASGDPSLPAATPVTMNGNITTYNNYDGTTGLSLVASFNFTSIPTVGGQPLSWRAYSINEDGSPAYSLYPTTALIALDPTSQNGGVFNVQAELDVVSTPEPTPLAMLAAVGLMLSVRQFLRKFVTTRANPVSRP